MFYFNPIEQENFWDDNTRLELFHLERIPPLRYVWLCACMDYLEYCYYQDYNQMLNGFEVVNHED